MRIYVEASLRSMESTFFLMSKLDRMSSDEIIWLLWRKGSNFTVPSPHLHLIEALNPTDAFFSSLKERTSSRPVILWGGLETRFDDRVLRRNFSLEEFFAIVRHLDVDGTVAALHSSPHFMEAHP